MAWLVLALLQQQNKIHAYTTHKSIAYKEATSANTNEMCYLFADRFAVCFSPAMNDTDTIDAALDNTPAGAVNMITPFIDSEIVLSALTQLNFTLSLN